MLRTLLVVPCFNEAERLRRDAFESFAASHRELGFLFVDDGSSDGTAALLRDMAQAHPDRIEVLPLGRNLGKGEAVRRGMLRALDRAPRFAGYWDADLAAPLDALPEFERILEERPELSVVFGARVRLLGRAVVRSDLRHFLGRIFATLASQLLGLSVYDTQCGAKLFRCSPSVRALFEEPLLADWAFDVELLARMIAAREALGGPPVRDLVYELPLRDWHDVAGTKLQAHDVPRALLDLWRIHWHYLRAPGAARDRLHGSVS
jgi:glycosyltransferase involved in cell wall biosynthesis